MIDSKTKNEHSTRGGLTNPTKAGLRGVLGRNARSTCTQLARVHGPSKRPTSTPRQSTSCRWQSPLRFEPQGRLAGAQGWSCKHAHGPVDCNARASGSSISGDREPRGRNCGYCKRPSICGRHRRKLQFDCRVVWRIS